MKCNTLSFVLTVIIISACSNHKKAEEESNKVEKTQCIELPNFVINKRQLTDHTIIVECYLDDNSIHQFKDGDNSVNIIPIIRNETKNQELFIDKKTLVGYDTLDNQSATKFEYSILFPSPKGGDVRIYKILE